jgi:hypothetical protein
VNSQGYPVNLTLLLNASLTVPIFEFQANLVNMSKLEVNSTANLILCFQEQYSLNAPLSINNNSVYWAQPGICSMHFLANGYFSQELPFLNVPYAVAVFFQNATAATTAPEVNIKIGAAGDTCPGEEVSISSNPKTCVNATTITKLGEVIEVKANEKTIYKFQLSTMTITGKFTIECASNTSKLDFWFRRDGSPITDAVMGKCPGTTVVENPRNGIHGYYLFVQNPENFTVNFTIVAEECQGQTGGPGCMIDILNATTTPTLLMINKTIYYFKVNASVNNPVWVNVRRVNQTFTNVENPLIFASLNQLPLPNNADIGGCNQYYCDYVNVIRFNVTQNQTWYIGVQNTADFVARNGTSGVWFNSVCAPDCQDHGTCADSGPQIGFCDCIDGFIGVDCQTQNGFGPQFIVLIIIAVLVALTAVIGFGAWAYMRRKRGQYDLVS